MIGRFPTVESVSHCCFDEDCMLEQVSEDGALLARPDGHIAWRADSLEAAGKPGEGSIAAAADILRAALRALHYVH